MGGSQSLLVDLILLVDLNFIHRSLLVNLSLPRSPNTYSKKLTHQDHATKITPPTNSPTKIMPPRSHHQDHATKITPPRSHHQDHTTRITPPRSRHQDHPTNITLPRSHHQDHGGVILYAQGIDIYIYIIYIVSIIECVCSIG